MGANEFDMATATFMILLITLIVTLIIAIKK